MHTHPNSLHETTPPYRLYYCALCDTDVDTFCGNVGACKHKQDARRAPGAEPEGNAIVGVFWAALGSMVLWGLLYGLWCLLGL